MNKIILIKSLLTRVLYDCFKLIYAYLNERDKVCECYSCLKMVIQAHLHTGFFTISFIKRASETVEKHNFLNKRNNYKCLAIKMFA